MPKLREIKNIQQLDNIVRNNTVDKVNQMIENGELQWDQSKYTIVPVQEDPSLQGIGLHDSNISSDSISANSNEELTQSGLKAAFQPEYVVKLNDMTKDNYYDLTKSFQSLSKVDQILSDGYELRENRTEAISIGLNVNDYGKKENYHISEFENSDGQKQHLITYGYDMVQMSYKQMLNRQEYAENHPPQWVKDASQFAKEAGWDKQECTELFRMMNSDRTLRRQLPYTPGDRESISKFAMDYNNDIQEMIRGIAASENWHHVSDSSDSISSNDSSRYDIHHEMNKCGPRRIYDAFSYTTSKGTGSLMSAGYAYYSDSISIWHDFNIKMAQEYVREQMTSISRYRDFVKNLPENNIGHVASVLNMKKEVVDYIAKEGNPQDMRNYLTVSDQTIGKTFFCANEVAKTACEVVRYHDENGYRTFGFIRSDVIPTASMIHRAENFTKSEKKELLSAAIANIYDHGNYGVKSSKETFQYMLQSETKEFIVNYLQEHNSQKRFEMEKSFLAGRIDRTIASMEGTISLKTVHAAFGEEFDNFYFGTNCRFYPDEENPLFQIHIDGGSVTLPVNENTISRLNQAMEQSRVEAKEMITKLAHSAIEEIEKSGKQDYDDYEFEEELRHSVVIQFEDYSICNQFSISVMINSGMAEVIEELSHEDAERILMEHIQNSYEAVLDENEGSFYLAPKENTVFKTAWMKMVQTGNEYLICPVFSADGPDYSEFGYPGVPGSVLVKNGEVIEDSFCVNSGWEEQKKRFDHLREAAVENVSVTKNGITRDESAILQQIAKQENCSIKRLSIDDQNMVTRTIMTPTGDTLDVVLGKYEEGKLDRTYEPDKEVTKEAAEHTEAEMDRSEELDEQDSFDSQDL